MDVELLDAQVKSFRASLDGLTFDYILKLKYGDEEWTLIKRFSEFQALHSALYVAGYGNLPAIPPRGFSRPMEPATARSRQQKLNAYLTQILIRPDLRLSSQVMDFLDFCLHVIPRDPDKDRDKDLAIVSANDDNTSASVGGQSRARAGTSVDLLRPLTLSLVENAFANERLAISDLSSLQILYPHPVDPTSANTLRSNTGCLLLCAASFEDISNFSKLGRAWSLVEPEMSGAVGVFCLRLSPPAFPTNHSCGLEGAVFTSAAPRAASTATLYEEREQETGLPESGLQEYGSQEVEVLVSADLRNRATFCFIREVDVGNSATPHTVQIDGRSEEASFSSMASMEKPPLPNIAFHVFVGDDKGMLTIYELNLSAPSVLRKLVSTELHYGSQIVDSFVDDTCLATIASDNSLRMIANDGTGYKYLAGGRIAKPLIKKEQLKSIWVDTSRALAFLGTSHGQLLIYNIRTHPPRLVRAFLISELRDSRFNIGPMTFVPGSHPTAPSSGKAKRNEEGGGGEEEEEASTLWIALNDDIYVFDYTHLLAHAAAGDPFQTPTAEAMHTGAGSRPGSGSIAAGTEEVAPAEYDLDSPLEILRTGLLRFIPAHADGAATITAVAVHQPEPVLHSLEKPKTYVFLAYGRCLAMYSWDSATKAVELLFCQNFFSWGKIIKIQIRPPLLIIGCQTRGTQILKVPVYEDYTIWRKGHARLPFLDRDLASYRSPAPAARQQEGTTTSAETVDGEASASASVATAPSNTHGNGQQNSGHSSSLPSTALDYHDYESLDNLAFFNISQAPMLEPLYKAFVPAVNSR